MCVCEGVHVCDAGICSSSEFLNCAYVCMCLWLCVCFVGVCASASSSSSSSVCLSQESAPSNTKQVKKTLHQSRFAIQCTGNPAQILPPTRIGVGASSMLLAVVPTDVVNSVVGPSYSLVELVTVSRCTCFRKHLPSRQTYIQHPGFSQK